MAKKVLLAALSTTREIDGEDRKVRFPANKVADLTKDEIELLDRLTRSSGRPHYRDPVNEDGAAVQPEAVEGGDNDEFDGQSVPMEKKSVDQLKAYLDHHGVGYDSGALKADLLKAANAHATDGGL